MNVLLLSVHLRPDCELCESFFSMAVCVLASSVLAIGMAVEWP